MTNYLKELAKPFHPSRISWKPGAVKGERALALAYADLRVFMERLDDVCGEDWSVTYEPWGNDRIICKLTIGGITRASTGETTNESEKSEIGGTVAEAQSFKRAAAMFGLGRYLYTLPSTWVDFDPQKRQLTEGAKAKLTAMLVQHYRRATEGQPEAPQDAQEARSDTPVQNVGDAPTADELAQIKQWANRTEAEMWSVMIGACENEHHARKSLENSIAKFGGKVTKANYQAVYVDFLRHQKEKLQQAQQAEPA